VQTFCGIAILISSLGLFGLSSFTTRQRTREMSIRKVLGASAISLVRLLTKEFLFLIVIASCVALPISYVGITQWLEGFAYHIDSGGWIFLAPILMILIIAFLTISVQTLKAVNTNPLETLKHE
ncbi:MAG TPA: FtsX-like permease family protein, partial [Chryseosolibacter sp.]|nr:FtsX-like permease family protein [Chryseosolibacter sp.]